MNYGAGLQNTAGANDIFIAKYTSTGGFAWAKTVGGSGYDGGMGIATDSGNNVLVDRRHRLLVDREMSTSAAVRSRAPARRTCSW